MMNEYNEWPLDGASMRMAIHRIHSTADSRKLHSTQKHSHAMLGRLDLANLSTKRSTITCLYLFYCARRLTMLIVDLFDVSCFCF